MSEHEQTAALRLADNLENLEATGSGGDYFVLTEWSQRRALEAASELRRLDAENKAFMNLLRRAQPAQAGHVPEASCGECGKKASDGWALYCVACMEEAGLPAQAPPLLSEDDMLRAIRPLCHDDSVARLLVENSGDEYRAIEQAVLAKRVPQWIATADQMPPPDTWLLVTWGNGAVDKAHTFSKWEHPTNPLGYLIHGHPGSHDDVTHWMPLPPPPGIVGEKGGA